MAVALGRSHTAAMGQGRSDKERTGEEVTCYQALGGNKATGPGSGVTEKVPTFRWGWLWGLGRQQHMCMGIPGILAPEKVAMVAGVTTGSLS